MQECLRSKLIKLLKQMVDYQHKFVNWITVL